MRSKPYRPPCKDCAFRPGSKELLAFVLLHAGPLAVKLEQIHQHVRRGAAEVPFFCHQGMATGPDGSFLPQVDATGVPSDANLCGGYANVLEDEREDLDDAWLLQAVRQTRKLVRLRILELRSLPDDVGLDHATMLDLLLAPGKCPKRLERSSKLRAALLEGNPLRCTSGRLKDEELAEVLANGDPALGLPSLVEASATWMADPARATCAREV